MSRNRGQSLTLFGNPISHPLNIILIINCAIFLLQNFANQQLIYRFALIPEFVVSGAVWQVFTYGFLHAVDLIPFHLLVNMYGMYMLGTHIIPIIGKTKFTIFYFLSQLGAGIFVVGSAYLNQILGGEIPILESMMTPTIGASGALFGLLALFGVFYPNTELLLFVFPVRAKNAVWFSLLIGYLFSLFGNGGISNTCHLGGAVTGLLLYQILKKQIRPNGLQVLPGFEWEDPKQNKNLKPAKQPSVEDLFVDQKKYNETILSFIQSEDNTSKIESYLLEKQVQNANICPPSTYNTQDPICLRCEWLPNCALRKTKE
ncbi:rhomboid family intramembrane serine protease [Leptospira sp. 96542]|nr:rhomboid family intramembrane serine protease [Leptospira sp. 96542]